MHVASAAKTDRSRCRATATKSHLRFEDGLAADVDLSYLLDFGGVFEPLRDIGSSALSSRTALIAWPNEADIAPETLYDHVQRAEYEKRRALSS